jgi:hypothetical protein
MAVRILSLSSKVSWLPNKILPPTRSAVPEVEHDQEYFSPWFVFNDFAVKNVSESEALTFPAKWKVRRKSSLVIQGLIYYRHHAF